MDKITSFIRHNEEKLQYVYLSMLAIHAINCYARPDYNIILYALLYLSWTSSLSIGTVTKQISNEEKNYSYIILIVTFILDIFWFFIYSDRVNYIIGFDWFIWKVCGLFSTIALCVKFILILALGVLEWEVVSMNFRSALKDKMDNNQSSENRFNIDN